MIMIDYSRLVISITFEQLRNKETIFEYTKVKEVTVLSLLAFTIVMEWTGFL